MSSPNPPTKEYFRTLETPEPPGSVRHFTNWRGEPSVATVNDDGITVTVRVLGGVEGSLLSAARRASQIPASVMSILESGTGPVARGAFESARNLHPSLRDVPEYQRDVVSQGDFDYAGDLGSRELQRMGRALVGPSVSEFEGTGAMELGGAMLTGLPEMLLPFGGAGQALKAGATGLRSGVAAARPMLKRFGMDAASSVTSAGGSEGAVQMAEGSDAGGLAAAGGAGGLAAAVVPPLIARSGRLTPEYGESRVARALQEGFGDFTQRPEELDSALLEARAAGDTNRIALLEQAKEGVLSRNLLRQLKEAEALGVPSPSLQAATPDRAGISLGDIERKLNLTDPQARERGMQQFTGLEQRQRTEADRVVNERGLSPTGNDEYLSRLFDENARQHYESVNEHYDKFRTSALQEGWPPIEANPLIKRMKTHLGDESIYQLGDQKHMGPAREVLRDLEMLRDQGFYDERFAQQGLGPQRSGAGEFTGILELENLISNAKATARAISPEKPNESRILGQVIGFLEDEIDNVIESMGDDSLKAARRERRKLSEIFDPQASPRRAWQAKNRGATDAARAIHNAMKSGAGMKKVFSSANTASPAELRDALRAAFGPEWKESTLGSVYEHFVGSSIRQSGDSVAQTGQKTALKRLNDPRTKALIEGIYGEDVYGEFVRLARRGDALTRMTPSMAVGAYQTASRYGEGLKGLPTFDPAGDTRTTFNALWGMAGRPYARAKARVMAPTVEAMRRAQTDLPYARKLIFETKPSQLEQLISPGQAIGRESVRTIPEQLERRGGPGSFDALYPGRFDKGW